VLTMRWVATAASLAAAADMFVIFTILWVAGPLGWSGAETAVFVIASRVPALLGGVLGGRAVDRFGARPMLLFDAVARTVTMGAFVVAGVLGELSYPVALVLAAMSGTVAPISYAAARSLVPRLVEDRDLGRANALLAVGDQLVLLVAAGLVGPAVTLLGTTGAFAVAAVMMVGVGLITLRLPSLGGAMGGAMGGATGAVIPGASADDPVTGVAAAGPGGVTGARSPWRSTPVLALVSLSIAYYFAYGPFEPVLPFFVRDNLQGGANTFSVLWVAFGVGAVVGVALGPRLASLKRLGVVNAVGAIAWGVITLPLLFTHETWVAVPIFAVSGVVWGPYSTVETTALQRWTPASHHGRVFGTQRALLQSVLPVGAALGAVAVDHASAVVVLGISLAGCSLAGLAALALPAMRRPTTSPTTAPTTAAAPLGDAPTGQRPDATKVS
jgi:MFS family permease